jgi:hypothetical protein
MAPRTESGIFVGGTPLAMRSVMRLSTAFFVASIPLAAVLSGCFPSVAAYVTTTGRDVTGENAFTEALRESGAHDLACPVDKVGSYRVPSSHYGSSLVVEGCGKRAFYTSSCDYRQSTTGGMHMETGERGAETLRPDMEIECHFVLVNRIDLPPGTAPIATR